MTYTDDTTTNVAGLKDWAIKRRKHYEQKRKDLLLKRPYDKRGINVLGAKIKVTIP